MPAGDKIPRKGTLGIIRSDPLVINKTEFAPRVGASTEVMNRDARKMQGDQPIVFTNIRSGGGHTDAQPSEPSPRPRLRNAAACEWRLSSILTEIMSDPMRIAPHNAVFLDFDGTLVDIASQPFTVTVPSELGETIVALHGALGGALAIISGRPIAEIDRYIDTRFCLPVAGVHGAEIRGANGYLTGPRDAEDFLCIIAAAERLSTRYPGLFVEHKPMAVAVHYRDKPHLADVVRKTLAAALETLPAMNMVEGKAVVEVKPEWANKGYAVTRLLQTPPFKSRLPIVIGDDATDEDGFRAALDAGGMAVKVGPGDTIATARLTSPAHVRDWLAAAVDELNREPNH